MNILLASPVLSDAATVTGSSVAATLPLSNLKTMPIRQPARFTSPSGAFILVDFGTATEIDLVALLGHNCNASGNVRVRAAATESDTTASPAYDSGILDAAEGSLLVRNHFILHMAAQTYRYWRIDFDQSSLGYIDVGRLYLAKVFKPEYNIDYGEAQGFIDQSTIARTVSGRDVPNERAKRRVAQFTLSFGSEAEMYGDAFDLEFSQGATRDVLYVKDYDNKTLLQKRTIYGRMSELGPTINPYYNLFEKNYRIEEIVA